MLLTALGRAAARRVLIPSWNKTYKLSIRLSPSVIKSGNGHQSFTIRPLTVSAVLRLPARSSPGSKKAKSSATRGKSSKKTKKTVVKKKKAVKKPAAKKAKTSSKKKTLTPEEKDKAELRELKRVALLKRPQLLPETAWSVFVTNNVRGGQGRVTDQMKEVSQNFSGLSVSEKDRLQSTANSNREANKDARQQWLNSFPPEAIYLANIARRRIARKTNQSRIFLIHDDRLPKRARTSFTHYVMSRYSQVSSGTNTDAFRALATEWRSLSDAEKQPFKDEAAQEAERASAELQALKEKAKAYVKAQKVSASKVDV